MNCIFFRWQSKEVSALRSAFTFWHSVKGADTTLATLSSHSGTSRIPSTSARKQYYPHLLGCWRMPAELASEPVLLDKCERQLPALARCAGFLSRCRPRSSTSCCCILCQRHLCRSVLVCRGCWCGRSRFSDNALQLLLRDGVIVWEVLQQHVGQIPHEFLNCNSLAACGLVSACALSSPDLSPTAGDASTSATTGSATAVPTVMPDGAMPSSRDSAETSSSLGSWGGGGPSSSMSSPSQSLATSFGSSSTQKSFFEEPNFNTLQAVCASFWELFFGAATCFSNVCGYHCAPLRFRCHVMSFACLFCVAIHVAQTGERCLSSSCAFLFASVAPLAHEPGLRDLETRCIHKAPLLQQVRSVHGLVVAFQRSDEIFRILVMQVKALF